MDQRYGEISQTWAFCQVKNMETDNKRKGELCVAIVNIGKILRYTTILVMMMMTMEVVVVLLCCLVVGGY